MSNKSVGTKLEKELASILADNGFWVHLFQENKNGQPCDVVASKNGKTFLFDCKNCETNFFALSRMEENQYNAMSLFDITGNGKGMFAIRYPDGKTYLLTYDKVRELQEAGFKRINASICRTQGKRLEEWLTEGNSED